VSRFLRRVLATGMETRLALYNPTLCVE